MRLFSERVLDFFRQNFTKNYLKLFLYNFVTVFCGVFLACLIWDLSYVDTYFSSKSLKIYEQESYPFSSDFSWVHQDLKSNISEDFKFVGSIVSLVKEHYVDKESINNFTLILSTIENIISMYPRVSFSYSRTEDFKTSYPFSPESIGEEGVDIIYLKLTNKIDQLVFSLRKDLSDVELSVHLLRFILFIKQDISMSSDNYNSLDASSLVLNSMLSSLDPHSSLLSKESYEDLKSSTEGRFGGVGLTVSLEKYYCVILEVVSGSPADRSKELFAGDKIIKVNDTYTFGLSLDSIGERMRGNIGDTISLDVISYSDGKIKHVELKREDINRSSVTTKKISDNHNIAYIKIDSFCQTTKDDLIYQLKDFSSRYGSIEAVVLDLRGNPGGLLDQAIEVSDVFLSHGTIVSTRGELEEISSATTIKDITSKPFGFSKRKNKDFSNTRYPMVVLVDQNSASASEIVAGALQDNSRALIIGQPTFGKGSVQSLIHIANPQNPVVKLTISRYYTPSGNTIQNTGITPDVWLQPVYNKNENLNLLGDQRFDSENFHKNRLTATSLNENNLTYISSLKGYYLTDSQTVSSSYFGSSSYELEIASDILVKVLDTYDSNHLDIMSRPYHWLGLAQEVSKKIVDSSDEVESWLSQKFGIGWTDSRQASKLIHDIRIQKSEKELNLVVPYELSARRGESFTIPVKIENNTNQTLDRLSVFVVASNSDMQSREILLDKFRPFYSTDMKIKVDLPLYPVSENSVPILVGLAQDSKVISSSIVKTSIRLIPADYSDISYKVVKKESKNKDELKFSLSFSNQGTDDIKSMKIDFVNLSGSLLDIYKDSYELRIKKSGSGTIDVLVHINDKSEFILDQNLDIGMNVYGTNLEHDITKILRLSVNDLSFKDYSIDVL